MDRDYYSRISYLVLEAGSLCNLKCKTCNRERMVAEGKRDPKKFTVEELESVLKQFDGCVVDTIKFEGLSEPMLDPEFDKLTAKLREYFPKAKVIVFTNGQYNLTSTSFLKTLPLVNEMQLSIDGTGKIYEEARTGASYPKMLKTLEDIKQNVSKEVRETKVFINFVLTKDNYLELPKIYKLKEENNLAAVRINLAQNWNEDQPNPHEFDDKILDFLKPYKNDVRGVGGWEYKDCFWPFSGTVVDVFGNVRQCIINTSMDPIGNIFEKPIKDIFNESKHLNNLRTKLKNNEAPKSCKNCDYKFLSPILQKLFGGKYQVNKPRMAK